MLSNSFTIETFIRVRYALAFYWIMVHSASLSAKNSSSTNKAAIVHRTSGGRLVGRFKLKKVWRADRALASQKPSAVCNARIYSKLGLFCYFTSVCFSIWSMLALSLLESAYSFKFYAKLCSSFKYMSSSSIGSIAQSRSSSSAADLKTNSSAIISSSKRP